MGTIVSSTLIDMSAAIWVFGITVRPPRASSTAVLASGRTVCRYRIPGSFYGFAFQQTAGQDDAVCLVGGQIVAHIEENPCFRLHLYEVLQNMCKPDRLLGGVGTERADAFRADGVAAETSSCMAARCESG